MKLTQQEIKTINNILDYFTYHNKNLTKTQYNNIMTLKEVLIIKEGKK